MVFKLNLARSQEWLDKLRHQPFVRSLLTCLNKSSMAPTSLEYEAWQHRFLLNRLGLCLWLAFVIVLTFIARDFYNAAFPLREMQDIPERLRYLWIPIDATLAFLLISCLVLHKTQFVRRRPAILFLGLSWSITLAPQVLATLWRFPLPDILAWSLVFLIQATLIPVRWELHLISQLGLLGYFYGVNSILGLTSVPALPGQPEQSIFVLTLFMYLFWFCFICDLAVYLYEQLQRAEFESRRQTQLFLHAVSHDLRNPVTGTSLVLKNLLKKQEPTIAVPRILLERMIDSSDRQLNLINSLLEVHNSDMGGIVLSQKPVKLQELVNSVVSDLEPQLQENRVTLKNLVSPLLPLVNVDETQIWRVFCNLIANALHHNPPGVKLTIDAVPNMSSMIYCSVQDTGVGMTSGECNRIFDLYARGTNGRRSVGMGLGLYLCRQIVTAHGGEIGVISAPSAGATFWFTLPIVTEECD